MMRNNLRVFIYTLVMVLALAACKSSVKSTSSAVPVPPALPVEWQDDLKVPDRTNYHLDTFYVKGNRIFCKVRYDGGCESHRFRLISDGQLMKTKPARLTAALIHEDNGDACREIKEELLIFETDNIFQRFALTEIQLILNKKHDLLIFPK